LVVIAVLLFLSSVLFYLARSFEVSQEKPTPIVRFVPVTPTAAPISTPTTVPTRAPTSTPTIIIETPSPNGPGPAAGTDAQDIFYRLQAQLLPPHSLVAGGYDTDWKGWPYTPERNAFWWKDNGILYEVAAFASPGNINVSNTEAVADANYSDAIQGNRFASAVDGSCMILTSGKFYCCPAADDPYFYALASDPGCQ
jgi:hypothetical protein